MRWTVVNDKRIFFIHAKRPNKFTDPVFKDLTIYSTLLLCDLLLTGKANV